MSMEKPDIYTYADYRLYLKELHAYHKKNDGKLSHRYIASKVHATSAGWFSDVISGRINLSATYILPLAAVLKLNNAEKEYFRALVNCNQTKNLDEKNRYLELLISSKKTGAVVVSKERFMYYSTWYIPVIREILFFYDFTDDYKALARMVRPSIRPTQARNAITILRELEFIEPDERGYLKPKDAILRKEGNFKSVHWANFQKSALELAVGAIERFTKNERDISSVLISLSSQSMAIARDEIARLRKKLLELSEADKNRNTVYQCNFQLFPTSRSHKLTLQGGHDE